MTEDMTPPPTDPAGVGGRASSAAAPVSRKSVGKIDVPESVVFVESGVGGTNSVSNVRKLTPTQRAGMWLAATVGLVIVGVIIIVVCVWFQTAPTPPRLADPPFLADPAKAQAALTSYQSINKAAIENYKVLNVEAISRVNSLFDLLATKALLPIFTAILGYIFGSREAIKGKSEADA